MDPNAGGEGGRQDAASGGGAAGLNPGFGTGGGPNATGGTAGETNAGAGTAGSAGGTSDPSSAGLGGGGGQPGGSAGSAGGPKAACASDQDCEALEDTPRCDADTGACVECLVAEEDCGSGFYCGESHKCEVGCESDDDCWGETTCNTITHQCVNCTGIGDCPPQTVCVGGVCIEVCADSEDCPEGQECCTAVCQNVATSTDHCGGCDAECPTINGIPVCNEGECSIVCERGYGDCDEDPRRNGCETTLGGNTNHCGACGVQCSNDHGGTTCEADRCVPTCQAGFADCDALPENGCEQDIASDPNHCGACGQACLLSHAEAACQKDECVVSSCEDPWYDCNGDPANGCEVNLLTDALNCGECGKPCSAVNGVPACSEGGCTIECKLGFGDCNTNAGDGCEVDFSNDVLHCGECDVVCPDDAGTPFCQAGICGSSACDPGYGDCNGESADGCEADLNSDLLNCGTCGQVCTAANGTPSCNAGDCVIEACNDADPEQGLPAYGDCNGDPLDGCEQALNTEAYCGSCDSACVAELHAQRVSCGTGECRVTLCEGDWSDCNDSAFDGCEVDTDTDVDHCGNCGARCSQAHGTPSCNNGFCSIDCDPDYGDCDGNAAGNGCETTLSTNADNCGGCGEVCAVSNGTPACADGQCLVAACDSPYQDCDGNPANGCEVDTTSSVDHCGACQAPCDLSNIPPQICQDSVCQIEGEVFSDDFESGAGNWNIIQSIWSLTADDTTVFTSTNGGNEARAVAGDPTWTDLTISARLKITSMGDSRRVHLAARFIDSNNWYGAAFRNTGTRTVAIRKKVAGDSENVGTSEVPFAFVEETWYHVRLQIAGNELTMWVDDVRITSGTDDTFAQGSIALLADRSVVSWDDIVVTVP